MTPYYSDASVTLYHGDCREVLPTITWDVLLTDPPYGIRWSQHGGGKTGKSKGMRTLGPIAGDLDVSLRDQVLEFVGEKPGLVFGSFRAPFPAKLVEVLIHQKTPDAGLVGSVTGFRHDLEPIFLIGRWPVRAAISSGVIRSQIGLQTLAKPGFHPHVKPLDVLSQLLHVLPPGIVLDPFAGAGSVLVAAKRSYRHAIGIEIEERYCEITAERLHQGVLSFAEAR